MNNAGNPPARQGSDSDEYHRDQDLAAGAVKRWIRRLQGALGKLVAGSELLEAADRLEENAVAVLATPASGRGSKSVRVTLWKSQGPEEVVLDLDPALPAREQAQSWLARARKMRRTRDRQSQRTRELTEELQEAELWRQVLEEWKVGPEPEKKERRLREVRLDSLKTRLLPRGLWPQPPPAKGEARLYGPLRFPLPGGWLLLAGRSGTENDFLTGRIARPDDLWFHAAHVPGSHVILKSPDGKPTDPPVALLELAAGVAAWLSKLRAQEKAEVHWTRRRSVRKPRKAPPGTVLLEHSQTLLVKPVPPPREGLAEA
jgi:predicted ribosome quality control (RQC) complex YloA/Tae2 family protein